MFKFSVMVTGTPSYWLDQIEKWGLGIYGLDWLSFKRLVPKNKGRGGEGMKILKLEA